MTLRLLFTGLVVFCTLLPAQDASRRWVVVAAERYHDALKPLVEWREQQGLAVAIVDDVAKIAAGGKPSYVLLIGDLDGGPAPVTRALYRWRKVQPKTFPSDMAHGDLDGDLVPDVPVGRIPFQTPKAVAAAVAKILAFEKRPTRSSDLRLVAWGGAPGYGGAIDRRATKLLSDTIRKSAPDWADPWMISAAIEQPLCGWPPDQPLLFNEALRRGGLLSAICAHAGPRHAFSMRHGKERIIYGAAQLAGLTSKEPLAPMVLLACDAGSWQGARPCLAEMLLSHPGGPVASIAATTESHPLTNYYTGRCLLKALSGPHARTIGDAFVAAQRAALKDRNALIEFALKDAEGKLEPKIDVAKLRRDQALMYALIGDPATRLKLPRELTIEVEKKKDGVHWSAAVPQGAVTISAGFRSKAVKRQKAGVPPGPAVARARFKLANAALAHATTPFERKNGVVRGVLTGRGQLRVVVETADGVLVGVAAIN